VDKALSQRCGALWAKTAVTCCKDVRACARPGGAGNSSEVAAARRRGGEDAEVDDGAVDGGGGDDDDDNAEAIREMQALHPKWSR
jgi:hypothetical protein